MGFFSRFPYTDFHRLNADWILDKIKEMLGLAQDAVETVESYDDRLTAVEAAAAGSVRYDEAQELTSQEQHQAQQNMNVVDASVTSRIELSVSDLDARAVQVEQQSFTTTQQAQARDNIGAASVSSVASLDETVWGLSTTVERCVRVDVPQTFTDEQKTRARDNIGAAPAAMTGAVRYDNRQELTPSQQILARENIGAPPVLGTVRSDVSQSLTTEQQAQARANIGAAAEGSVPAPAGAVLYDQAQSLTAAQKTQAQDNIGAAPTSSPVFTSSIEISSQATSTIAADQIMIYPSTLQADTVSKLTIVGDVSPVSKGVILQNIETPVDPKDAANKAYVDNAILKQISVTGNTPVIDLASEIDGVAYETLITCTGSAMTSITISTAANSPMLATIVFTTGSTAPTFDSPLAINGLDDLIPAANTIYEISIRSNRAVWHSWEVPSV